MHLSDDLSLPSPGVFAEEVIPVSVKQRRGEPIVVHQDEGIRADATLEGFAKLRAIQKGGVVTAANACQQNDSAAAWLMVAEDKLAELGLKSMGFLVGWAAAGREPASMGIGPMPVVEELFRKTGLSFNDMDLVELNEAFACQVLACLKGWGWDDPDRLNVNGSGISIGHPVSATGVRML